MDFKSPDQPNKLSSHEALNERLVMLRKSRDRKLVRVVVSRESIQISAMPLTQLMITGAARENREKHEFVNKTKTLADFCVH